MTDIKDTHQTSLQPDANRTMWYRKIAQIILGLNSCVPMADGLFWDL